MRARRKRSGHFLCFGAVDTAKEAAVKTKESSAGTSGRSEALVPAGGRQRRRLDRRVLEKIFGLVMFVSAPNRSRKERKDPNYSVARKASDDKWAMELSGKSSDGDDRTAVAIFSSFSLTSPSTSSSSCLSPASSSSFREAELGWKRASPTAESRIPQPAARAPARKYVSTRGLFLLLLILSVMVFCGRFYAILWTSSWLCFVPRRNSDAGLALENAAATKLPELRRTGWRRNEKLWIFLRNLSAGG